MNKSFLEIVLIFIFASAACQAQTNPNLENGIKPFGSYDGADIDQVNLQTGGLSVRIPLFSYPQRGDQKITVALMLGSKGWVNEERHCLGSPQLNPDSCQGQWNPIGGTPGLTTRDAELGMYLTIDDGIPMSGSQVFYSGSTPSSRKLDDSAPAGGTGTMEILHYVWMPDGSKHYMMQQTSSTAITVDGTNIVCKGCTADPSTNNPNELLTPDGSRVTWNTSTGLSKHEDRNGNIIQQGGLDTMGRAIYAGLSQQATDTSGCDSSQTSATLLTFPGPTDTPGSASRQVKLCFQTETLKTAFGVNFDDDWGNSIPIQESSPDPTPMLAKVILYSKEFDSWSESPAWRFEYNYGNPGGQNPDGSYIANFGDLTKITLPTGGAIQYGWTTNSSTCSVGSLTPVSRWITERSIDANDGAGPQKTTYGLFESYAIVWNPAGNKVVHTFTTPQSIPSCGTMYETTTQWYAASTLLKTVQTNYAAIEGPAYIQYMPIGTRQLRTITTLDDNSTTEVETDYDQNLTLHASGYSGLTYGTLMQKREYAYGAGSPGALLRCTSYSYEAFQGQNAATYLSADLINLPHSVTTYSGACTGTPASQITYGHDESSVQSSSITTSLDTSNSDISGVTQPRGNQTSVSTWLGSGATPLLSTTQYFDTGLPYSTTDPGQHTTYYTYSPAYAGAYLTLTKMPDTNSPNFAHHTVSGNYDFNTGSLTSYIDQNGQTSEYGVDSLGRIISAAYPDGGATSIVYDSDFLTVHLRNKLDGSRWADKDIQYDGLGRVSRNAVLNGESSSPYDQVDYCYNKLGLLSFQSYLYQGSGLSSGKVCSGAGDIFGYDGLNRRTSVTHSDSSQILTTYTGAAVDVRDEGTGGGIYNEHVSQMDGLGRLSSVCEVSSTTQLGSSGSSSPTSCNQEIAKTGFLTSYGYDALNNLTSVQQAGLSTRQFIYDQASRLTNSYNPESGWTNYFYNSDSLVRERQRPAENQNSSAVLVDSNYSYDELHRLRTITYVQDATQTSDPYTPSATLSYDETTAQGTSVNNPTGNLTSATTAWPGQSQVLTGQYFTYYDNMGRPRNEVECTPSTCSGSNGFGLAYQYDYVGDLTQIANAQFGTQINTYNQGARLYSVTHSAYPASPLLSQANYSAFGITNAALGSGSTETTGYDTRGRFSNRQLLGVVGQTIPATYATASVTLGGSEQSKQTQTQTAKAGSGTVEIDGSVVQKVRPRDCPSSNHNCWQYDFGSVWIAVNGVKVSYNYAYGDTVSTVTSGLAKAINGNAAMPVTASGLSLTAKATGAVTNYSLSAGTNYDSGDFSSPSFSPSTSGAHLAGGADAATSTIYDAGAVSVTVNGYQDQTSYQQGTQLTSIVSGLASAINGDSGSPVTASVSGNSILLTSKQSGPAGDYSFSSSVSYDTSDFSSAAFTISPLSSALTGGMNAVPDGQYNLALGYYPNGNVQTANDSVNGNWTYGYDEFNRLASSSDQTNAYSYKYDRYGNRWQQNLTAGSGFTMLQTYSSANNRIDEICYDAAGNLLDDRSTCVSGGAPKYIYDAENRLVGTAGTVYVYNYAGTRVAKQSGSPGSVSYADTTEYLLGQGGDQLAEINGSGGMLHANVFAGGRLWATITDGQPSYHTTDWLGTRRLQTSALGLETLRCTNLPFGDGQYCSGSGADATEHHFTGKERDSESGNDYFGARYYSSSMGRFMSPDWSAKYEPVPYAKLDNPQTLNLYAYVGNNPLNRTDPTGHYEIACGSGSKNCNQKELDRINKQIGKDQVSKNKARAAAAGAYGALGEKNGVTVTVVDQPNPKNANVNGTTGAQAGTPGFAYTPDGKATGVATAVTLKAGLDGGDLKDAIDHEGQHALDRQNYVNGLMQDATGESSKGLNITGRMSEVNAYTTQGLSPGEIKQQLSQPPYSTDPNIDKPLFPMPSAY